MPIFSEDVVTSSSYVKFEESVGYGEVKEASEFSTFEGAYKLL